jgi:hypothetical protein
VQSIIAWGFARTPACAEATWRVPPSARSAASRPPPAGSSGNLPAASNSRNSTGATPGVDPCPPTPSRCCLANNTASRGRGRRPPVWSEFAKGKGNHRSHPAIAETATAVGPAWSWERNSARTTTDHLRPVRRGNKAASNNSGTATREK